VIGVGFLAHERTVRMATFVMRAPDRDHEAVYRRMLERNLRMAYWRFGLDPDGDLFLAAHLNDDQLGPERLDAVLGLLVTYVDETYEGLVRMGFDIPAHIRVGAPPLTDSATPGLADA
jgi:Putative bacterial sensory transduction regulator